MINWMTPWSVSFLGMVGSNRLAQPIHKKIELQNEFLAPLTAQQAWEQISHILHKYDKDVVITQISSEHVVEYGMAPSWVFQFDCLNIHAKGEITWSLTWNGDIHHWAVCEVVCQISPYPYIGSPVYNVAALGNGNLLDAAWKQMRSQSKDVPEDFQDTDQIWSSFHQECDIHLGKVIKLSTVVHNDTLCWEVLCGSEKMHIAVKETNPLQMEYQLD